MRPSLRHHRAVSGFSLLELVVVLAILTTLAGLALPVATRGLSRARYQATEAELTALGEALRAYFSDTWRFPPTFEDLASNGSGVSGWAGPYMLPGVGDGHVDDTLSTDAWGADYTIKTVGASRLEITSRGADGKKGGTDDIVLVVDVTPERRRASLAELDVLNAAIAGWNADHLPDEPLPATLAGILSSLGGGGWLPADDARYEQDGWGDAYIVWPAGSTPVVGLASPNLVDEDDG